MKKNRYTESQILKQTEAGVPVVEFCRKYEMRIATFYFWRTKYRGMDTQSKKRLKKLEEEKVNDEIFKNEIRKVTGCNNVRNYYGMIEQTGAIYIECEYGNMHAPNGSNFLIRSSRDFVTAEEGESGLIQIFSDIQTSYPGHSLLSEDIGISFPFSTCSCGSQGQILNVLGRAERSEVRGCSDAVN